MKQKLLSIKYRLIGEGKKEDNEASSSSKYGK